MKTIIKKYTLKTLTVLLVFVTVNSYSQFRADLLNNYGGTQQDIIYDIVKSDDGNFVISSSTTSNDFDAPGYTFNWIFKLDNSGSILWSNTYGGGNKRIIETQDKGFITGGRASGPALNGGTDFWLTKIDSLGVLEWQENYGGSDDDEFEEIIQLSDGSYIMIGTTESSDQDINNAMPAILGNNKDIWVVKISSLGVIEWEKSFGGSNNDIGLDIIKVNNGYMFVGSSYSTDFDLASFGFNFLSSWLVKIDLLGNIVWQKQYQDNISKKLERIIEANNGTFTMAGENTNQYCSLINIDSLGNINWNVLQQEIHFGGSFELKQKSNSNYVVAGNDYFSGSSNNLIVETNSIGMPLRELFIPGGSTWRTSFTLDDDENVIFGINNSLSINNDTAYGGIFDTDIFIYKLHPLFASVYGNILIDNNINCISDLGDVSQESIILNANDVNTLNNYYGNTDISGNYTIAVDTNPQMVSVISPSPYYETSSCSMDSILANISSNNLSDTIDFFITPTILCPYMEVDISTPLLRRCFSNTYYVSYCNNGTQTANNAFVEVDFDSTLIIDSSSIPYTTVVGNTYTFPIGNVDVFDCGDFAVYVSVPCDSTTFLGQVLCAEAHVFPDSLCLPSSNTWNGAELEANAECIGQDSVVFTLKNIGFGNMDTDVPIIGIEDVILIMDTDEILNAGEEIKWKFPTNGIKTHRIIAQQPNDHPYKTFTTDAVANCNLTASAGPPPVTDSAFLAYPNDEESPFEAIDCQPVIGAYDPNDKTVYPSGVSANHFISETTDLEYKIRFQNTGTDTAFTVVIRDSISNLLDLSTFSAGASSHSYTYNIYGTGVIDFTFNNILLPDSFINEPASHGFVQYKIEQQNTNTTGDIILNNADIFFDFNEPVRTNTVFSEIGGIILDTLIYKFPSKEIPDGITDLNKFNIKIYPNPASDFITFELNETLENISIELFNIEGKMQQKSVGINTNKLIIERAHLARGMYLFKIYSNEKEIAYGKLIFE